MQAAKFLCCVLIVLLPLAAASAAMDTPSAATPAPSRPYWVEQLADGLNVPWGMVWLPSGDLVITEKFGGLRIFRHGKLLPEVIEGPPGAYKAGPNGIL